MRALVIDHNGPRLTTDRPEPDVAPGEALVRIEHAGVSPLELAVAQHRIDHEGPIGHEVVGIVEKIAPPSGRTDLVGKRVVCSPNIACAACDLCKKGLSAHCRHRRVIGLREYAGGLAGAIAVPVRHLVEVPSGMDPAHAALAPSVADAVHVAHLAPVEKQTYVSVLGDGAGAILAAQVLAKRNASVRLIGAREERFGLCERWQIRHRHISEPGLRADQDVVVVALEPDQNEGLCSTEAMRTALGMLRPRGSLVIQGPIVPVRGLELSLAEHLEQITRDEFRVLGARSGRLGEGVEAIKTGVVDLVPLITRRAPLTEGVGLLRAAAEPDQIRTIVNIAA